LGETTIRERSGGCLEGDLPLQSGNEDAGRRGIGLIYSLFSCWSPQLIRSFPLKNQAVSYQQKRRPIKSGRCRLIDGLVQSMVTILEANR
jgi:hypothetical protein